MSMNLQQRKAILMTIDSIIVLFSIFIGYFLLAPTTWPFQNPIVVTSSMIIFVTHHIFSTYYGLYRKEWAYASIGELISIFKAVTFTIMVVAIVQLIIAGTINFRALVITWMLHLLLIGGSRLSWRLLIENFNGQKKRESVRTLIIGAGAAGRMVARQLTQEKRNSLTPVAFLDDDPRKIGSEIYGLRIYGGEGAIERIVKKKQIEHIVIAIPSLPKEQLAEIAKRCIATGIETKQIPRLEDLMLGKVDVTEMRDVQIEDLLGRDEVHLDLQQIQRNIKGKTVLITGAGGSIGSELSRQVASFEPKSLLLLGHGESSIYEIERELRLKVPAHVECIPIIADIKDRKRIFEIVGHYQPDIIYHAAAHKHVPLMEANPREAVKNNIFGTKNVAEAADQHGVKRFVLVSTDKAVNPPNVMGATKRFAEMVIQNLAQFSRTKFAAVRFGNVLGSRGSVIPLFKEQIARGGPVTVTDERMTRYFMTIPEASKLVLQAGMLAEGGEIFVLDMGEPVKIVDLAKNLIQLSGYSVEEIGITFSGIRPGEKLYEELLNSEEIQEEQIFPGIHIGKVQLIAIDDTVEALEKLIHDDQVDIKNILLGQLNSEKPQLTI